MSILDEAHDWQTLRDDNFKKFYELMPLYVAEYKKQNLPNYTYLGNFVPEEGLFPLPEHIEGGLGDPIDVNPHQLMKVGLYDNSTPQCAWLREVHNLKYVHAKYHIQPVKMLIQNHIDHNGSFTRKQYEERGVSFNSSELKKILHFLNDWKMGQVIMLGDQCYSNWKKGDAISFPWFMEHATANANYEHERHLLFITGV